MRYLTLSEVLEVHRQVMAQSGGAEGLMHLSALESALAQPQMTFGGEDLASRFNNPLSRTVCDRRHVSCIRESRRPAIKTPV